MWSFELGAVLGQPPTIEAINMAPGVEPITYPQTAQWAVQLKGLFWRFELF
jgi:hypothetical protein